MSEADAPWCDALRRAAYLVEHLVQQVPEFTGVIGPGGESEDEYIRCSLLAEAQGWRVLAAAEDSHEVPE